MLQQQQWIGEKKLKINERSVAETQQRRSNCQRRAEKKLTGKNKIKKSVGKLKCYSRSANTTGW